MTDNASPHIRARVSPLLKAAIVKAAKKRKMTESDFVRLALATSCGDSDLASMRDPGRPPESPKTKAE